MQVSIPIVHKTYMVDTIETKYYDFNGQRIAMRVCNDASCEGNVMMPFTYHNESIDIGRAV
jgi:hypothetical protein